MKEKKKKNPLSQHEGCKGCTRRCQFNRPDVATKEVAMASKNKKFACHDGGLTLRLQQPQQTIEEFNKKEKKK